MRAERPEGVLVRAQLPEVEAVRVDVVDVAELAGVGDLLQLGTPGWYSSRWPTIRIRPAALAAATARSASSTDCASGFSTKQCLPALEHALGERRVGRDRRGEHDGVERVVGEQVVEVGREARGGNDAREALARRSEASQHQASSQPGSAAKLRARFGPQ